MASIFDSIKKYTVETLVRRSRVFHSKTLTKLSLAAGTMNLSLCFMSDCVLVGSQPKDMRESTSAGSEPNMENWLDTSFGM